MTTGYVHMHSFFKGFLSENFSTSLLKNKYRCILSEFNESLLRGHSEINLWGQNHIKPQIRSFCLVFKFFKNNKKWSLSRFCLKLVVRCLSNYNQLLACWMQVIFSGELKMWQWEVEFLWPTPLSHVLVSYSGVSCRRNKTSLPWVCLDMELCYQNSTGATFARR